ncbi:MAG TPA: 4Fe-4S dicluster domain-containing protein [Candidatus Methylomirabilis sp.]|nr:4Fe-4S dicluster domain-containing protein [Candidatus Methylomirabilis sp.]
MRIVAQALSLLLFTLLFASANYRLPDWLPADLYLRLDPLLGLSAILAGREIISRALWSLILLGATLAIGRFFCAYLCPLGATLDFLDLLFFRKTSRQRPKSDASLRHAKYAILFVFLGAALTGLSLVYLLDPLALLTRFYTFVLYPLIITLLNLALDALRPLLQTLGWIGLSRLHYPQAVYYMPLITCLIFGGIIALNRVAPRFWCRYLCPLGALLSLISPLGLFRRRVNLDCTECQKCQRACPMGAAADEPHTHLPECIQCRTCAGVCPEGAIRFPAFAAAEWGGEYSPVDFSRRGFLYSLTGGVSAAFLVARTPYAALRDKHQLIRPPGAIPEADFMKTCIRCGECMKSCLTNTLQPSLWDSGLAGLWTPRMELRFAPCEQDCNVCGKVCPTQALRALSLEEKTHAKVGTAVLRKEMCLVWAQDKLCLICDEVCPYNAIVFRTLEGYRRPVVIASKCNGCGYCEARCPIEGESAIVVVPNGQIRLKEGSYVKAAERLQLEFRPDPGDDRFLLEESGLKVPPGKDLGRPAAPNPTPRMKKPKGFL